MGRCPIRKTSWAASATTRRHERGAMGHCPEQLTAHSRRVSRALQHLVTAPLFFTASPSGHSSTWQPKSCRLRALSLRTRHPLLSSCSVVGGDDVAQHHQVSQSSPNGPASSFQQFSGSRHVRELWFQTFGGRRRLVRTARANQPTVFWRRSVWLLAFDVSALSSVSLAIPVWTGSG